MSNRNFHLRLSCRHTAPHNEIADLVVEVESSGKWQPFHPDVTSPGFLLYVYALFSCQLRYLRLNSAERNLVLESSQGDLKLVAGKDWGIKSVTVAFRSRLKEGHHSADDIAYIQDRMKHCPVSTNFRDEVELKNEVIFE
jgi:hypothetical protein